MTYIEAVSLLSLNPDFNDNKINIIFKYAIDKNILTTDDLVLFFKNNKIKTAEIFINYYQDFEKIIFQKLLNIDINTASIITHLLRKKVIDINAITKNKGNIEFYYNKWYKSLNKIKLLYNKTDYNSEHFKIIKNKKNLEFKFIHNDKPKNLYIVRDDNDLIHYIDFSIKGGRLTTIIENDFMNSINFNFLSIYPIIYNYETVT